MSGNGQQGQTVMRWGKESSAKVCPSCVGRGAKWMEVEGDPGGRPQLVRDLRGIEKARAVRFGMRPGQIWPCMACGGEGVA